TQESAFGFVAALDELSHLELYAATAHHLRALHARAAGSIADARVHATGAAVVYRTLGWPLHEAHSLSLAGERREPTRIDPLSAREREIAQLVADGAGNARIASDLAVSQRTIEKYLTSIYGKLQLRNRSELAAMVARRDRS
ncbi:MAG: helix-turn-helix transcriptional regulator, partial [Candidatus Eremiobacteraeota bacterium]|nr:helix-turn-helix transcriptional regulator [Candidatus Eremiobacteraeota bacterium]